MADSRAHALHRLHALRAGSARDADLTMAEWRHEHNRLRPDQAAALAPQLVPARRARPTYLQVLTWLFTLFNSVRVLAYLPTIWAIHTSGDSSQHSLLTWLTWAGANATMAAWLYEHNGQRLNRAIAVNLCNATMCVATTALIVAYRV